jgi:hypothetical protein
MTTAIIGVETSEARWRDISSAAASASCWPGGVASSRPYRTETYDDQRTDSHAAGRVLALSELFTTLWEGARRSCTHPPAAVAAVSHALGVVVRDVVLTRRRDPRHQPVLGRVSLLEWLKENASTLGRAYVNELDRHFRVRG